MLSKHAIATLFFSTMKKPAIYVKLAHLTSGEKKKDA